LQAVATLKDTRGEQYPEPGSDPKLVAGYVKRLVQDGDAEASNRFKRATHNLLFVDGSQWIDWNLREKTWRPAPAPEGRVRVVMNYIRPILRARLQRLMSAELSWRAVPDSNAHEAKDRATVATNIIEGRWHGADMDAKVRAAEWLAFSTGTAYLKPFWNSDIGTLKAATVVLPHPLSGQPAEYKVTPDGQPLADPETGDPLEGTEGAFTYRPGDVDTAVRSIFNIRINPDAFGLLPSEGFRWLVDSEVMPISVVKEKYGDIAKNVSTVAGVQQLKQFESLIRTVGGRSTASSSNDLLTGKNGQQIPDKELTVVSEYWEAPSPLIPGGRLVVIGGDEMLSDTELPQGFVPHIPIYDERRPFDAYGRPTVDDLVHPQKVINKQWSMILEEQSLAGIGQWAMFDVPGLSDQISNLSAAHIKIPMQSALASRSIGDLVQRLPGVQVSSDRWRMVQEAKATMFDIGAFHEIQRGQVPPGVDSGIAVQLLEEAENGQLHDAVSTLEASLIRWGEHTLRIAKWGYGKHEERWIPVERPDLGYLVESVKGSDLPDPDTLSLRLDGFRPQSQSAMRAEIKEAVNAGWMDPRKGMQLMDLGRGFDAAFESQTRHYARARGENLAIERGDVMMVEAPKGTPLAGRPALLHPADGSPFLLPSNDDHAAHIELHEEIYLDDSKPWPVRQVMAIHISEHQAMLALVQQQQVDQALAIEKQKAAATQAA
jgi:hypothetical protein